MHVASHSPLVMLVEWPGLAAEQIPIPDERSQAYVVGGAMHAASQAALVKFLAGRVPVGKGAQV